MSYFKLYEDDITHTLNTQEYVTHENIHHSIHPVHIPPKPGKTIKNYKSLPPDVSITYNEYKLNNNKIVLPFNGQYANNFCLRVCMPTITGTYINISKESLYAAYNVPIDLNISNIDQYNIILTNLLEHVEYSPDIISAMENTLHYNEVYRIMFNLLYREKYEANLTILATTQLRDEIEKYIRQVLVPDDNFLVYDTIQQLYDIEHTISYYKNIVNTSYTTMGILVGYQTSIFANNDNKILSKAYMLDMLINEYINAAYQIRVNYSITEHRSTYALYRYESSATVDASERFDIYDRQAYYNLYSAYGDTNPYIMHTYQTITEYGNEAIRLFNYTDGLFSDDYDWKFTEIAPISDVYVLNLLPLVYMDRLTYLLLIDPNNDIALYESSANPVTFNAMLTSEVNSLQTIISNTLNAFLTSNMPTINEIKNNIDPSNNGNIYIYIFNAIDNINLSEPIAFIYTSIVNYITSITSTYPIYRQIIIAKINNMFGYNDNNQLSIWYTLIQQSISAYNNMLDDLFTYDIGYPLNNIMPTTYSLYNASLSYIDIDNHLTYFTSLVNTYNNNLLMLDLDTIIIPETYTMQSLPVLHSYLKNNIEDHVSNISIFDNALTSMQADNIKGIYDAWSELDIRIRSFVSRIDDNTNLYTVANFLFNLNDWQALYDVYMNMPQPTDLITYKSKVQVLDHNILIYTNTITYNDLIDYMLSIFIKSILDVPFIDTLYEPMPTTNTIISYINLLTEHRANILLIEQQLTNIDNNKSTTQLTYKPYAGIGAFKKINMHIGKHLIFSVSGEQLYILLLMNARDNDKLMQLTTPGKDGIAYVPLDNIIEHMMSFYDKRLSPVTISYTLNDLTKLVNTEPYITVDAYSPPKVSIYVNYYKILDLEVVEKLVKQRYSWLIEQHNAYTTSRNLVSDKITIKPAMPMNVRYIYFTIKDKEDAWLDFKDIVDTITIKFDNKIYAKQYDSKLLNYVIPNSIGSYTLNEGIYVYSLALLPLSFHSSGYLDNTKKAEIDIKFTQGTYIIHKEVNISMYWCVYNVLHTIGGQSALHH